VFVVNKADREGAETTVHDLKQMISFGRKEIRGHSWRQPIVRTVASKSEGVDDVVRALADHRRWLGEGGELVRRRVGRAAGEIEAIALQRLRGELGGLRGGKELAGLAKRVVDRELDPYTAADTLISDLRR
jgi:LAO/AO transport system kinase